MGGHNKRALSSAGGARAAQAKWRVLRARLERVLDRALEAGYFEHTFPTQESVRALLGDELPDDVTIGIGRGTNPMGGQHYPIFVLTKTFAAAAAGETRNA